jgi:hypothetical protein
MYRLLENIRPARKTADTQQEATAKEAANRLGKSVEGAVEITIARNLLGGQ